MVWVEKLATLQGFLTEIEKNITIWFLRDKHGR